MNVVSYLKTTGKPKTLENTCHSPMLSSSDCSLPSPPSGLGSRVGVTGTSCSSSTENRIKHDPLPGLPRGRAVSSASLLSPLHPSCSHQAPHTLATRDPRFLGCGRFFFVRAGPHHTPLAFAETLPPFPRLQIHACCSEFILDTP